MVKSADKAHKALEKRLESLDRNIKKNLQKCMKDFCNKLKRNRKKFNLHEITATTISNKAFMIASQSWVIAVMNQYSELLLEIGKVVPPFENARKQLEESTKILEIEIENLIIMGKAFDSFLKNTKSNPILLWEGNK